MHVCTERQTVRQTETGRQTEKQTNRQTDRGVCRDRLAGRPTDKTGRQAGRQTDRKTDRQTTRQADAPEKPGVGHELGDDLEVKGLVLGHILLEGPVVVVVVVDQPMHLTTSAQPGLPLGERTKYNSSNNKDRH